MNIHFKRNRLDTVESSFLERFSKFVYFYRINSISPTQPQNKFYWSSPFSIVESQIVQNKSNIILFCPKHTWIFYLIWCPQIKPIFKNSFLPTGWVTSILKFLHSLQVDGMKCSARRVFTQIFPFNENHRDNFTPCLPDPQIKNTLLTSSGLYARVLGYPLNETKKKLLTRVIFPHKY